MAARTWHVSSLLGGLMALFIPGRTVCALCGQVISVNDEAESFPPLTSNTADPVFRYSDASFHRACVDDVPDGLRARQRAEELLINGAPDSRRCEVCDTVITDPDDYVGFGFLTSDDALSASRFNFVHLHRSHVRRWSRLDDAIEALRQLEASGTFVPTDAIDSMMDLLLEQSDGAGGP